MLPNQVSNPSVTASPSIYSGTPMQYAGLDLLSLSAWFFRRSQRICDQELKVASTSSSCLGMSANISGAPNSDLKKILGPCIPGLRSLLLCHWIVLSHTVKALPVCRRAISDFQSQRRVGNLPTSPVTMNSGLRL